MGCDTVGFILIGPKQISAATVRRAVEHLKGLERQFGAFIAAANKNSSGNVADAMEHFIEQKRFSRVKEIVTRINGIVGLDDIEEEVDFASDFFLEMAPQKFMDEFCVVWYDTTRSTMTRRLPGSKTKQIWVNAIQTWGGGELFDHDENYAGYIMYYADIFNVLPVLGIE